MSSALPEPLSSPEIDVRDLDGFLLNAERLLASELWALSTGEELKAAVALWCRAWKQLPGGSLPNDDRILASFAGVPAGRWSKVKKMALRGFVLCSDGRLYHPLLCEDAARAFKRKLAHRAKAQAGAQARWNKPSRDASSNAPSIRQAMPGDAQGQYRDNYKDTPLPPKGDAAGLEAVAGGVELEAGPCNAPPAFKPHPEFAGIVKAFSLGASMGPKQRDKLNAMLEAFGPDIVRQGLTESRKNKSTNPIAYADAVCNRIVAERPITRPTPSLADVHDLATEQAVRRQPWATYLDDAAVCRIASSTNTERERVIEAELRAIGRRRNGCCIDGAVAKPKRNPMDIPVIPSKQAVTRHLGRADAKGVASA